MNKKFLWGIPLVVILVAGLIYFGGDLWGNTLTGTAQSPEETAAGKGATDNGLQTTVIRPAANVSQVSAAGNIGIIDEYVVVLQVDGVVAEVNVDVGDYVEAGALLTSLDTTDLERALEKAKLSLANVENNLANLSTSPTEYELKVAELSLSSTQENLADLQAGPDQAEISAAQAQLAANQARYQELLAGKSDDELVQLGLDLEKKRLALEQAQYGYDRIAYSDSVGASSQATALRDATLDYEASLAAFNVATVGPSDSDLQSALSDIQSASSQLTNLRNQPTKADLTAALKQVAEAEATLADLVAGASDYDLETARINVAQEKLNLAAAEADLAAAKLVAPVTGTVLSVDVEVGQRANAGLIALTLADLSQLQLTVNVAEVDIAKIKTEQVAQIEVDALPEQLFSGLVATIAPASDSDQGVVNYPVSIILTDSDLSGIRPGMTAVATLLDEQTDISWLVPTNALRERNNRTLVMVLEDGQPTPVEVIKTGVQGDWSIVQSPDLKGGEQVIGTVSSIISETDDSQRGFGFGPPGGGRGGNGGGPPGGGPP